MQAGLQGFHLLRGIFSSLTLFFLAGPIANFLGIPEVGWAYQMLALLPTIYGLIHFDIYRLQRQMNYLPSILSTSIPAFLCGRRFSLQPPPWWYRQRNQDNAGGAIDRRACGACHGFERGRCRYATL